MCLLLSMNCFDLSLRLEPQEADTGQRSLFGLSAFALKPLLPVSISLSWFIAMCLLVSVRTGPVMDTADQSRGLMGLFGSSMNMLIEFYLAIANCASHSGNAACQTQIRLTGRTVGISLAEKINKTATRACICVLICVRVKGMVSAWQ